MMKRFISSLAIRIFGLILAALIFIPALAQGQPYFATMFSQWLENVHEGEPVSITLSAALHEISPYGEQTVVNLNRLLENIRANILYQQTPDGETTQTQLLIGDTPALSFTERAEGSQSLAQASFLPGITLSATTGAPLQTLLGEGEAVPAWVTDVPDISALPDKVTQALAGLSSFAQEKKVSYSIASVGSAKKALVYTVPEENVQILRDALSFLVSDLAVPGIGEFIGSMTLSGSATVTLYQSAQGENIGLALKGTLGFQDVTPRKVNFLWGFSKKENKDTQTISLKSPAVKGNDALTITGKALYDYTQINDKLSFSLDIRNTLNKKTDRSRWNGELACLIAQDNQRLEGKIEQKNTLADGTDETLTITPSLLAYQAGEAVSLKGSVRVKWAKGKQVQGDVSFSLLASKGADPAFAKTAQTLSTDEMGENQLTALREQGELAAAQAIWQAAAALPHESLALVLQGITQSDWEAILGEYLKDQ